MSGTSELPPVDPGNLVPWRVPDRSVAVGDDWVLPSREDVLNTRAVVIVPPARALELHRELITPDEVAAGGLNRVFQNMYAGIGRGVGIAAVQVGEPYDVVGVRTDPAGRPGQLTILAGARFVPDLVRHEEAKSRVYGPWGIEAEGCLTLPAAMIAHPLRYLAGVLIADFEVVPELDDDGTVKSVRTRPWEPLEIDDQPGERDALSRVVQHEADHIEGWLFPDRVYAQEAVTADYRFLTGAVHWVHRERYAAYVEHLLKIRQVLKGEMGYLDLPELRLPTVPYEQYQALRAGRIAMPRPTDL